MVVRSFVREALLPVPQRWTTISVRHSMHFRVFRIVVASSGQEAGLFVTSESDTCQLDSINSINAVYSTAEGQGMPMQEALCTSCASELDTYQFSPNNARQCVLK